MAISNEPMVLPMLYKLDSKGQVRCWRAWTTLNDDGSAVENNESGLEGGTLSGIPITVTTGKNIGKKNETTPLQQANKKILSKYDKKVKEGYVQSLNDFTQQGVMKAHDWKVSKHRMSPIALKQPKLDGIRLKIIKESEEVIKCMSKSNNEFKPHIYDMPWVRYLAAEMNVGEEVDGEMYIHGMELNDIGSLVMKYRANTTQFLEVCVDSEEGLVVNLKWQHILDQMFTGRFSPEKEDFDDAIEIGRNKGWIFPGYSKEDIETIGSDALEFWMFDMPDEESMAEQRNANLAARYNEQEHLDVGIVAVIAEEFEICDIEAANDEYVSQGFEGTMVRKPSGTYVFGDRTADLQKFKLSFDAEWIIEGFELDRQGNPTFLFTSALGFPFACRPKGTQAWRSRILQDMENVVTKPATIRYQKLFAETLVPQFGRVVAIRDYE